MSLLSVIHEVDLSECIRIINQLGQNHSLIRPPIICYKMTFLCIAAGQSLGKLCMRELVLKLENIHKSCLPFSDEDSICFDRVLI